MFKHCLRNSQISEIPEYSQREIEVLLSTLKSSPFLLAQIIKCTKEVALI